jgi:4-amino-4-deoxy-L-arabinose transferase-like glycosyltransferase
MQISHTDSNIEDRKISSEPLNGWLSEARLRFVAAVIILITGLFRAEVGRYSMNPDGICYLDMGDAFFHRRWVDAVNGYWSPLYPWLLGLASFLAKPSRWQEFPLAHAVNFCIYAAAFFAFDFFLRSLIDQLPSEKRDPSDPQPLSRHPLMAIGYAIFLWSSLDLITVFDVTPDLCVAGFVYLIAGLLLRLRTQGSAKLYLLLGIALGLAFLAKAVLFPLAFVFIVIGFFCLPRSQRLSYALLVTFCFLLVSAPWLIALSRAKGRFTFGDTGTLNYSSFVSPGGRVLNWQGEPPASGTPVHATRKIYDNPPVYQFASPVGGTYPPSYDPSYWNEGRRWTFDAKAQMRVVKQHLLTYAGLLFRSQSGLLAGVLALVLAGGVATRRAILRQWPLLALCLAAMGLYMLVHVETRFVGAYVTILWMAILSGVRGADSEPQRRLAAYLAVAMLITVLLPVADGTVRAVRAGGPYSARGQVAVADELESMGLHPGDRVAVVGDGNWSYWARSGKFKIVATVMGVDTPMFWADGLSKKQEIYKLFATAGAKAVVTSGIPASRADPGWRGVGTTEYYVRFLLH